jgi:hypothetical protein
MPYMVAQVCTGYDDLKHDTLKLDGPLVPSMKKLIEKYGIPQEALFTLGVVLSVAYGSYFLSATIMTFRIIGIIQ